ncbi:MAG: PIG-L deacetylase family protein [Anaerolineae bacterium]
MNNDPIIDSRADDLRVLIFGAHPDDCDLRAGGIARIYAQLGHRVQMVSLTNGDAGHYAMGGAPLAWRRREEAAAAARCLGVEYLVLDHHDAELMPTLDIRGEVVTLIRDMVPDLVMAPRLWDYHPDHRATAQLVIDALYLSTVPNYVSSSRHLDRMPVAVSVWDAFQRPSPFSPDVVVDISDAFDAKLAAIHCHTSQVYEWLPYNRGELARVPADEEGRRRWLAEQQTARAQRLVEAYQSQLVQRYGAERAKRVRALEAFEVSEYGAPLTAKDSDRLFPF